MSASYTLRGQLARRGVAARPSRDTIVDLEHYPEWWPQVRAVASLGSDDAWVVCRSALPYSLNLVLHAVSREGPVLEVAVTGDLDGFVRWRLVEEGSGTRMDLEQEVTVPVCSGWRRTRCGRFCAGTTTG